jgi:hypothetical protein
MRHIAKGEKKLAIGRTGEAQSGDGDKKRVDNRMGMTTPGGRMGSRHERNRWEIDTGHVRLARRYEIRVIVESDAHAKGE